jgi:hypothetical protein
MFRYIGVLEMFKSHCYRDPIGYMQGRPINCAEKIGGVRIEAHGPAGTSGWSKLVLIPHTEWRDSVQQPGHLKGMPTLLPALLTIGKETVWNVRPVKAMKSCEKFKEAGNGVRTQGY